MSSEVAGSYYSITNSIVFTNGHMVALTKLSRLMAKLFTIFDRKTCVKHHVCIGQFPHLMVYVQCYNGSGLCSNAESSGCNTSDFCARDWRLCPITHLQPKFAFNQLF